MSLIYKTKPRQKFDIQLSLSSKLTSNQDYSSIYMYIYMFVCISHDSHFS